MEEGIKFSKYAAHANVYQTESVEMGFFLCLPRITGDVYAGQSLI